MPKETRYGRWIQRDVETHRCSKPGYDSSVHTGDKWQCNECKAVWVVDKIDGDQRDGSTWIIWKSEPMRNSLSQQRDGLNPMWDDQR